MERGLALMVGLLGILKAGCAYVPLDPAYPRQRLSYMIKDAGVRCVLSTQDVVNQMTEVQADQVDVEWLSLDSTDVKATLREQSTQILSCTETGVTASNLVYVIYTSGSTFYRYA